MLLCFQSDFLIEEADEWRKEAFKMIKERSNCDFLFLTKRIDRFNKCIPDDWNDGYDNVIVSCTIENQKQADYRLPIFNSLPIKHKLLSVQPLIENINIEKYLDGIECVVLGGESDKDGRILDYDWVLNVREQCIKKNVSFEFRQCGTNFLKDGRLYRIRTFELTKQARLANINFLSNK